VSEDTLTPTVIPEQSGLRETFLVGLPSGLCLSRVCLEEALAQAKPLLPEGFS